LGVGMLAAAAIVVLGYLLYQQQLEQAEAEVKRQTEEVAQEREHGEALQQEQSRTRRQLELTERSLFNAQIWRAAGLWQKEPALAQLLLDDEKVCPPALRAFAGAYYHRLSQRERFTIKPHSGQVYAMTLAADGQTLITAGADGMIRFSDAGTGR